LGFVITSIYIAPEPA